jgi:hypothetical protein
MSEAEEPTPPKLPRGSWHETARKMRAETGMAYQEIGRRLGVSGPAVYFAIHPDKRWYKKTEKTVAPATDQSGKE